MPRNLRFFLIYFVFKLRRYGKSQGVYRYSLSIDYCACHCRVSQSIGQIISWLSDYFDLDTAAGYHGFDGFLSEYA
jgi:hypothetical protein